MRLIDADELKKIWLYFKKTDAADGGGFVYDPEDVIETIDECETLEVEPVRHGRWIHFTRRYSGLDKVSFVKCSLCGSERGFVYGLKYCPNCGAKMDLEG